MFQAVVTRLFSRALPALSAVLLLRRNEEAEKEPRRERRPKSWRKEVHPYYNLSVRVLRAKNIHGADLLSKADCYVQLRLPTASPLASRTAVVYNSSDPEWNETFNYRVHGAVKNILELTLYDRDVILDDKLSSVVFDIGHIKPGHNTKRIFKLGPKESLEVEFSLEKSKDPPTKIITNGVLVDICDRVGLHNIAKGDLYPQIAQHKCSDYKGKLILSKTLGVCKGNEKTQGIVAGNRLLQLSMPGSYEKHKCMPLSALSTEEQGVPFVFHADKDTSPQLNVQLLKTVRLVENDLAPELEKQTFLVGESSVAVSSLPEGNEQGINLQLSKDQSLEMNVKTEEDNRELDIRLGFELSLGEREFLEKRKKVAARCLQEVLKLDNTPGAKEVPVIAVLGSGGGTRAMTSFYGSLLGLQELKLLDSVTYISGVSGSTWCMSTLYEDPDWSQKNLQEPISRARKSVTASKSGAFSPERIKHCTQELLAMEKDGHTVNFTDLWGLVIEYFLHQKENPAKLSDQQACVSKSQNPYPVYAGVNVRVDINGGDFAEWCEFTPHEVGFRKYGAFVRTEDFASEFFMGHLIHRRQEPKICYLQGIWGSAFAANLDEIWSHAAGTGIRWLNSLTDAIRVIDDCRKLHLRDSSRLKTRLVMPGGFVSNMFQEIFKSRFTAGEWYNFTRGLYLYKDYLGVREFLAWKGTHLDAFPNQLTPMEENLYLVDGGFSINSPFPLVLQPERDVDVIFSFNYSWDAPFEVLHLTSTYCRERGIPFPEINLTNEDEKQPKECYVFMDHNNPRAPIVLHFPMVNNTFQKFIEPGVERKTAEEKLNGEVDLIRKESPYRTKNFTYEPQHFDRLVAVNRYNVLNSSEQIAGALKAAVARRKNKLAKLSHKKHI